MSQIDSFEFHFFYSYLFLNNFLSKIKREKNMFLKIRISRLVDYKKSFRSSVTRGKNHGWSIIIHHQWQHYIICAFMRLKLKKKTTFIWIPLLELSLGMPFSLYNMSQRTTKPTISPVWLAKADQPLYPLQYGKDSRFLSFDNPEAVKGTCD